MYVLEKYNPSEYGLIRLSAFESTYDNQNKY